MDIIIGIIAFIFALGLIILIHEGGHFYFATKAGILCREYAFGMGPQIFKKKYKETVYALRAFPIGGFCAIAGEEVEEDPLKGMQYVKLLIEEGIVKKIYLTTNDELFASIPTFEVTSYDLFDATDSGNLFINVKDGDAENQFKVDPKAMYVFVKAESPKNKTKDLKERQKKVSNEIQIAPHNRTLNSKSIGARAMVMFGGPMMNFILAIFVFFLSALIGGFANTNKTTLASVSEGTSAYLAGLTKNDTLLSLETTSSDDQVYRLSLTSWNDISTFMSTYKEGDYEGEITIEYLREGSTHTTNVQPMVVIYSISMLQDVQKEGVVIGELSPNSKAYIGGLRSGDAIKSIDGEEINSWKEVYNIFTANEDGNEMKIVVLRGEEEVECVVNPYSKELFDKTQTVGITAISIGISPKNQFNLGKSFIYAFTATGDSIKQMFNTLVMLFGSREVGIKDMSGPIGIFTIVSSAAQNGFSSLLYWIGFLNVNVGLLNLFPIPALDGGRLVFLGYEAITKKKVSEKVETILITVTLFLLMGLMIYVSFNDILRLFGINL